MPSGSIPGMATLCRVVQILGMQGIRIFCLPYPAAEIKYFTTVEMIRNGVFSDLREIEK